MHNVYQDPYDVLGWEGWTNIQFIVSSGKFLMVKCCKKI